MKKTIKKLTLKTESIKILSGEQLREAAGGATLTCNTDYYCTAGSCACSGYTECLCTFGITCVGSCAACTISKCTGGG